MRRPIALTDAELLALVWVSNVSRDDEGLWDSELKRVRVAHNRANSKLRAEARRRGYKFDAAEREQADR